MLTLSAELQKQGHQVAFATFKGRGLGSHVRRLGYETTEFTVRSKIDPIAILQMSRFIRANHIDLVHGHLSTSALNGCFAARLARIPGVATVHGMSGKLSFVSCHHLIAVSSEVREHLVAQGVHESKISIIPNGVAMTPLEVHSRESARRQIGIPLDCPVLGTTARLTPLKGISQSLAAFERISQDFPNAHYVVFGNRDNYKS